MAELARRYGVNKPGGQFFIEPGRGLRMFVLNTSRPLFKNNPKLRQAVNFAVDRGRLTREEGSRMGRATDQYLLPVTPGFQDERIYPLKGPDLKKARAAREGAHPERQGGAVHGRFRSASPRHRSSRTTSARSGSRSRSSRSQRLSCSASWRRRGAVRHRLDRLDRRDGDSSILNWMFDGRTIADAPNFGNWSYFDSPKYNRLLEEASRLTGAKRDQAYRDLDVMLSRDAAPASRSQRSTRWRSSPPASAASS